LTLLPLRRESVVDYMPKFLDVVNEKDEIIGVKDKRSCGVDDITRVSCLIVYNSKDEILIAKRVATKYYDPNKWSYSVVGTVEKGETYLQNIVEEAEEEIGLIVDPADLKEIYYGYVETKHKFFCRMYITQCDWPIERFRLQANEVAEARWIHKDDLKKWRQKKPQDFTASFKLTQEIVQKQWGLK
jgi:isopentenyl-diphosphate Delta-isomerase